MMRFYLMRVLKDYLGHLILIGLPVALIYLMVSVNTEAGNPDREAAALYIGIVYIIMFQAFGAAYAFEGLEHDFFKPFKARLLAAPVKPYRFVLANIVFSIVIGYAQSLVLLAYVMLVFNASVPGLGFVMLILLLGVIVAQLFGSVAVLLLKKAAKAQALMTLYVIGGMLLAGFFFPLPESDMTIFLSKYSSPVAWTHYAAYGVIEGISSQVFVGVSLLMSVAVLALITVVLLSKRVMA